MDEVVPSACYEVRSEERLPTCSTPQCAWRRLRNMEWNFLFVFFLFLFSK